MNPGATNSIETEIAARRLAVLYGQNHWAALATLFAAGLLSLVLWEVIDHTYILLWYGAMVIATAGRLILIRQYHRNSPAPDQTDIWQKRILLVATGFGVLWGLAGLLLFPGNSISHIAFVGFVIAGVTGGAVPYLSAIWPVYLITALPVTLIFAIQLFLQGGPITTVMGILVLFFSAMMALTSWRMNQVVTESISLRFDKTALQHDLELAKDVKEQATEVAKESDERVNVLADAPFEGIFIHEQGQILDANQTLLDMLKLRIEDVLGRRVTDFVSADSIDIAIKELKNPTGKAFHCKMSRSDGLTIPVEARGRLFPRKGRMIRVVSIRRITD